MREGSKRGRTFCMMSWVAATIAIALLSFQTKKIALQSSDCILARSLAMEYAACKYCLVRQTIHCVVRKATCVIYIYVKSIHNQYFFMMGFVVLVKAKYNQYAAHA